ncbi:MAG: histone deacetylase family protein [Chloroflexi bacterium]|nr:histone deacetylase family protein [Chloroflexota bacterium]
MLVVYSDRHQLHDPRHDIQGGVPADMVERPERAERILNALQASDTFEVRAEIDHGLEPVVAVHAPGLIAFVREASDSAATGMELFPDTFLHPGVSAGMSLTAVEPTDLTGRLGFWCFDTGTPVRQGTYAAARAAVDVSLTAADLVFGGEKAVYGLCRPPGHHAARSVFGGFCYFNNAAIAAHYLAQRTGGKIAILDIDYHHGNGTQQVFYAREDVLYVSLHADPRRAYPYFSGHSDETGTGPGLGTTVNLPLPAGVSDVEYLNTLDLGLDALTRYAPSVTVVSLGMDTYVHDPLGDFALTTPVYAECARRIAAIASKLVVLQEGGYYLPDLGENVRQFLQGLSGD